MNELPNWVYDLVAEIQDWEDSGHDPGGDLTLEQVRAVCHEKWLKFVPRDVCDTARAISNYKRTS
jgi:hypothetical protein